MRKHTEQGIYATLFHGLNVERLARSLYLFRPIVPNTEDTWIKLSAKHPKSPPPVPPAHQSLPMSSQTLPPDFNVLSVLWSFPKACAPGPTCLCIQHLLEMWLKFQFLPTSICSLLQGVIKILASVQAPAWGA